MNSPTKNKTDLEHFMEAMSDVTPIDPPNRVEPARGKPPAIARQRALDERAVIDELRKAEFDPAKHENGEELLYLKPGYRKNIIQRLRRGYYSSADSIDLHQMREQTALQVLNDFLDHALKRGYGCVRIIHGKGLRSRGQPVLKRLTERSLRKHPSVVAFASCRPVDGGTGAVDVLLSVKRRPSS